MSGRLRNFSTILYEERIQNDRVAKTPIGSLKRRSASTDQLRALHLNIFPRQLLVSIAMTAYIPAQGGLPESQYGKNFGLDGISTRFEDYDASDANANENDPADRPNLPNILDSGSSAEHLPPSDKKSEVNAKDATLRNVFENTMRDLGTIGKPHRKTAVLMVSWAAELDDLNTAQEVNDLESVFKEDFHYTVVKEQLAGEKPPGQQFSKFLTDFLWNYDSESTLLIIYYAGHGTPGKKGELHFTG
jgi:hypothetical protein